MLRATLERIDAPPDRSMRWNGCRKKSRFARMFGARKAKITQQKHDFPHPLLSLGCAKTDALFQKFFQVFPRKQDYHVDWDWVWPHAAEEA